MSRTLVRIIDHERTDANERVEALRLQAEAWRIIAIIGITNPDLGRRLARTMFFVSFPFVDGQQVRAIIEDYRDEAKRCGEAGGVFAPPERKDDDGR